MKTLSVWNTAYLGDTILTLPLIQTLAAAYPNAAIDFYVRKGLSSLFVSNPHIRNVIEYDKQSKTITDTITLIKYIKNQKYDLWINAHTSIRSSIITFFSRATLRIGYTTNCIQPLCCTQLIKRKLGSLEEIERLLDLLTCLPIQESKFQHWPQIFLSEKHTKQADDFWKAYISGPGLGINPGSVWKTKRWLPQGFATIVHKAIEQGAHVMLFGGPGEENIAAEVIQLSGLEGHASIHNLSGTLTLPQLAAFIKKLDCYVTNDSGPMHIAWSQKTPVTAIFGPTVKCLGFSPRGNDATVIEVPLNCRPCSLHGGNVCPEGHFRCMKDIDPNMVWDDIITKLFKTKKFQ